MKKTQSFALSGSFFLGLGGHSFKTFVLSREILSSSSQCRKKRMRESKEGTIDSECEERVAIC